MIHITEDEIKELANSIEGIGLVLLILGDITNSSREFTDSLGDGGK